MRKFIVANWKMYLTLSQSFVLAKKISNFKFPVSSFTIALCPSFVALEEVAKVIKNSKVELGAQDVFCCAEEGAFTGEVGIDDLRELGVEYVLVGHSERRRHLNETDAQVNQKLKMVLQGGLHPILCVGESVEIRKQGKERSYVGNQIKAGLKGVPKQKLKELLIAYEPIWAIGTGDADTPDDASQMHSWIRKIIGNATIPILYGGSVNSKNAAAFLRADNVDGLLIGGASTKSAEFTKILQKSNLLG